MPDGSPDILERQEEAAKLRAWVDAIHSVLNDAQVFPQVANHLGQAADLLNCEADAQWPRRTLESSDPPGPPTSHRIDVTAESAYIVPEVDVDGPSVAVRLRVNGKREHFGAISVPLRAVQPMIDALAEHLRFWEADADA